MDFLWTLIGSEVEVRSQCENMNDVTTWNHDQNLISAIAKYGKRELTADNQGCVRRYLKLYYEIVSEACNVKQQYYPRSRPPSNHQRRSALDLSPAQDSSENFYEALAKAYEYLQVSVCKENDYLLYWLCKRPGPSTLQKLNAFRMAQKIRNEHGLVRTGPSPNDFRSFEDIIDLERTIEAGDRVELKLRSVAVRLIEAGQLYVLYNSMSDLEQLDAYHDCLVRLDAAPLEDLLICYRWKFSKLTKKWKIRVITFEELKKYLRYKTITEHKIRRLRVAEILDEQLDEALNCVLNSIARRAPHLAIDSWDLVPILKQLLQRGASLYFRDKDEESFSIGALVSYSLSTKGHDKLPEFVSFMCCPLIHKRGQHAVALDRRVARSLYCLAAAAIPESQDISQIPRKLRMYIEAHISLGRLVR